MEYIIRRWIKNYENTTNQQVRSQYSTLAGTVNIICNLFLFGIKLAVGLLIHSLSVTADALNNLSDGFSSVISIAAVKLSERPADEEHPFGHGRVEYIAALAVAALVICVGVDFLRSSVEKIRHPEVLEVFPVSLLFLLLSVAVKLWMAWFNRKIGKRINNRVLLASSSDALFDALTTSVTIFSAAVYFFSGVNIDGYAGIVVSLVVIYAGIGIVRDTLRPLLGEPIDPELRNSMEALLTSYAQVIGIHDLIIHNYGPNRYMASVHMEVSKAMSLEEAHEIADTAEHEVLRKFGVMLVVHVDPSDINDKRVQKIHSRIERILQILDEELTMHDLQVHYDDDQTMITFDLAVPFSYTTDMEKKVVHQISAFMREADPSYHCRITVDRGMLES